ncbi:MAG: amidohydrolase family protein [Gammaproteobacteria bacterium]
MHDLIIRGGTVIDGTGAQGRRADVAIDAGRIAGIGSYGADAAREVIDAGGLAVTPGFVDLHTHYDAQVFWDPTLSPSPYHGVTTVLGGFCGFTLNPLSAHAADYLVRMLSRVEDIPLASLQAGVPCDWTTMEGFRRRIDNNIAVNAGFSAGHSALRYVAMGERALSEKAAPADIARMQDLLRQAIREGALGFSTSRSNTHNDHHGHPVPSRFAADEEYVALASVCGEFEGTSVEVMPGLEFDDATFEIMKDIGVAARRVVNWNLIALADNSTHSQERARRQMQMTDYARRHGAEVIGLSVPTSVGVHIDLARGGVFDLLPGWEGLFRLGIPERMAALRDPDNRRRLFESASATDSVVRWLLHGDAVIVEQGFSEATRPFSGKSLAEVARLTGKSAFDAMLDLALADDLKTLFTARERGEDKATYETRAKIWRDDRAVVGGSDAGAHVETLDSFAYFTRMLEQAVRVHGVISLEECVHHLTQAPARIMGLRERGELRPGWHADITVFDPQRVARGPVYMRHDFPGGANRLYADAIGVEHVFVNGRQVIRRGEYTGAKPGTLFKSGRDTFTVPLSRS